jgi:hypothetical protein
VTVTESPAALLTSQAMRTWDVLAICVTTTFETTGIAA